MTFLSVAALGSENNAYTVEFFSPSVTSAMRMRMCMSSTNHAYINIIL